MSWGIHWNAGYNESKAVLDENIEPLNTANMNKQYFLKSTFEKHVTIFPEKDNEFEIIRWHDRDSREHGLWAVVIVSRMVIFLNSHTHL